MNNNIIAVIGLVLLTVTVTMMMMIHNVHGQSDNLSEMWRQCIPYQDPHLAIIDLTCQDNPIAISTFVSQGWQIGAISTTTMYLTK